MSETLKKLVDNLIPLDGLIGGQVSRAKLLRRIAKKALEIEKGKISDLKAKAGCFGFNDRTFCRYLDELHFLGIMHDEDNFYVEEEE